MYPEMKYPFDKQRALTGEPVITADGSQVVGVHLFEHLNTWIVPFICVDLWMAKPYFLTMLESLKRR